MPYLVKVGYDAKYNRLTAQGYYISQSGRKVKTKWAGIYVNSEPEISFYWRNHKPFEKTHTFPSVAKAKLFMLRKYKNLEKLKFDKLPNGFKIYSRKFYD